MILLSIIFIAVFVACDQDQNSDDSNQIESLLTPDKVEAYKVSDPTPNDTDDPAVWINKTDPSKSILIGTDKDTEGGLYAFDLSGSLLPDLPFIPLNRPNNVDVEYGFKFDNEFIDIAVVTERNTDKIRVVSLPDFKLIDNGGISVFEDDSLRSPMGVGLYKDSEGAIYAFVSRKDGPAEGYIYQYLLTTRNDKVTGTLVRKFGHFSGSKEIESIAIDDKNGLVYYSDEGIGIRKYSADANSTSQDGVLFGQGDFKEDNEGISIYDKEGEGYVIVSDQQRGTFNFYERTTNVTDIPKYIGRVYVDAVESDGSETISIPLGSEYPEGLFVAMSDDKTFRLYRLEELLAAIDTVR